MSYVPKYLSESPSIKYITVDLELEGVETKKDLEGITHVDTSSFALKTNLSALKTKVDKLDVPKLGTLPTDVAKLTNKVANDLAEKTDFNSLKTKVSELENKIISAESKPDISNLATKLSVTAVKNKIPDVNGFVKKTDYATEITSIKMIMSLVLL